MKYHIEKLQDDGSWAVYRNGQTFNSPDAARRLLNRLMDRYGEDRVRLCEVGGLPWPSPEIDNTEAGQ